jgi:hypothetical protein
MTKNRRRILWPALLIALLVLTALTFAASRGLGGSGTTDTKSTSNQTLANPVRREAYIRRSLLSPKLVWHLNALGDRLEKPGRERLNVTGTLTRTKDSQTEDVIAVFEFPDRLRVTTQKGSQTRVITFDGEQAEATGNALNTTDRDVMETLIYGSAEHFFTTQIQGMATRFLGSRFRLDDGSAADYNGPYYDVYKVADQVKTAADHRQQLKLYYFNSETLLLERVVYEVTRNGSVLNVEERIGDWTKEQNQQVARRIERFENGESVFVLTVRTAGLSARADDGIFGN